MSEHVYFIISGTVHIMDRRGIYHYGTLNDGAYFGEISLLLNQPNNYSYFFNEREDKNLFLLQIDSLNFLNLCDMYRLSKKSLTIRAKKRSDMFNSYKYTTLMIFMKSVKKNPIYM